MQQSAPPELLPAVDNRYRSAPDRRAVERVDTAALHSSHKSLGRGCGSTGGIPELPPWLTAPALHQPLLQRDYATALTH